MNLMFNDLNLGAKSLLQYSLDILRDESPLPRKRAKDAGPAEDPMKQKSEARRGILTFRMSQI